MRCFGLQLTATASQLSKKCKVLAQVVQQKWLCELCGLDQICLCPIVSYPAGLLQVCCECNSRSSYMSIL